MNNMKLRSTDASIPSYQWLNSRKNKKQNKTHVVYIALFSIHNKLCLISFRMSSEYLDQIWVASFFTSTSKEQSRNR